MNPRSCYSRGNLGAGVNQPFLPPWGLHELPTVGKMPSDKRKCSVLIDPDSQELLSEQIPLQRAYRLVTP